MVDVDPLALEQARGWVVTAERVVALTGAGISTDSGIPDFRGPQGLWTKNPKAERMSDISHYLGDPEVRELSWQNRLRSPAWSAVPNAGHLALVDLERQGRLRAIVTQNIDELHQRAGNDPANVIEVHGTMRRAMCWSCGWEGPMEETLDRVRAGEVDPACLLCAGILKSATISFGQSLDPEVLLAAEAAVRSCDLLLAIGSTLQVYPAAALVPVAADQGARIVILNAGETGYDRLADAVLRGSISELLPTLVGVGPGDPT